MRLLGRQVALPQGLWIVGFLESLRFASSVVWLRLCLEFFLQSGKQNKNVQGIEDVGYMA